MKVIIAGSRDIVLSAAETHEIISASVLKASLAISEVVSGACGRGVDRAGEEWAKAMYIPVKLFPADWKNLGRRAGPVRNYHMANYADAAIVIWDGKSRGSANMIDCMKQCNKPYHVHIVKPKALID